MSLSREIKLLQKAKSKAQANNNTKEEASLCNQLGEVLSRSGDFTAAILEHQQELALSEELNDVIGRAVANRKIGECYAELGNIDAALKHQHCHLDLARSVQDHAEEQRALATIGRTYLFHYESDQSKHSLEQAEDAFRKSLRIVNHRLEGTVPQREISEMKARLFLNLGLVYDHLGERKRCSEFLQLSVFIAEKSHLLEDLYRANFNLGNIYFRNGQQSKAVCCLEQAKECAHKTKDKFGESECFHCIGKVQLSLGDFVAARRSLKKALQLGSQKPVDQQAVKKSFKYADHGCKLDDKLRDKQRNSHQAIEWAEQLGDLYCKVGCFSKALEAYQSQLKLAEALGKPNRDLAIIHVSLAATYADLRQHVQAVQHYRQELSLRQGSSAEECSTWLNIAAAQEESGCTSENIDSSFKMALCCAEASGHVTLQKRALTLWTVSQKKRGISVATETEQKLHELCCPDGSDEDEDREDDMANSEPLVDSDVVLSDSDEDLEGYDKMLSERRKVVRWNKRNEKGETFLHRACIDGNLKEVQYLLQQGHPANPRDYCGWTPLHEASNHGHYEIVALLLDHGANINDPGGPLCEGVTPLHDALICGNMKVAQLLIERGASATLHNSKGETALDTLQQWQNANSQELDQETRLECKKMEQLLKRAVMGGMSPTAPKLLDAEDLEPAITDESHSCSQKQPRYGRVESSIQRPQTRRTATSLLYKKDSSYSDGSDSDSSLSPLHPVHHRNNIAAAPNSSEDVGEIPALSVFARDEYHSAISSLGSAKTVLQGQSAQTCLASTMPASSSTSALVPEEEYLQDDWLEDDWLENHPKKKRRLQTEQNELKVGHKTAFSSSKSQNCLLSTDTACAGSAGPASYNRGLLLNGSNSVRTQQVKMTQNSGMVRLGGQEVSHSHSQNPHVDSGLKATYTYYQGLGPPLCLAHPIRMRVRVQEDVFLIPVPQSEADSCTVSWLCEQAAQRYYHKCGLLPRLSMQKEGALLSPHDLLLAVLHTNEEVVAEVCSWDLPPLSQRYRKSCKSLAAVEDPRVARLCEVQDCSSSMWVCGLSLPSSSLTPLLWALKLQTSLTELRLSGNRLGDALLGELVATTVTMPHLQLLDISSNFITGEGLENAVNALKAHRHPAFRSLEDLDLGLNPLGDGVPESLCCLLSCCPLLSSLSLQACHLTARFLQQHRILLSNALTGLSHLKSLNLSHNAFGSTGFELLLKSLPLQCLTHLNLSAVRTGATDCPRIEHLVKALSENGCSLTDLKLASNGLTDSSIITLSRYLPCCPGLVSLDLSGNPFVGSAGLHSILTSLRETGPTINLLNLQGCQVSGPWNMQTVDGLTQQVLDLRLCSHRLNKLDREVVKQSWDQKKAQGAAVDRSTKFLLSVAMS